MADRKRSTDGHRETDEILGQDGTVSHSGRTGGSPARNVATKDEKKRALERPAGATRVTGSMKEDDDGDA